MMENTVNDLVQFNTEDSTFVCWTRDDTKLIVRVLITPDGFEVYADKEKYNIEAYDIVTEVIDEDESYKENKIVLKSTFDLEGDYCWW